MTETTQALRCEIRADLRVTYFRYLRYLFIENEGSDNPIFRSRQPKATHAAKLTPHHLVPRAKVRYFILLLECKILSYFTLVLTLSKEAVHLRIQMGTDERMTPQKGPTTKYLRYYVKVKYVRILSDSIRVNDSTSTSTSAPSLPVSLCKINQHIIDLVPGQFSYSYKNGLRGFILIRQLSA